MEFYQPPFKITNKMMEYVSSIAEKVGALTVLGDMERKPHLRRNNRIKSVHASLKIEANSLSLGQVRDVINGQTVLGTQKEIQEVKNAYAAYEQIESINPYSLTDLKKLHGVLTKYVVEESGIFRSGEEGVFNDKEECIFVAPPARFVSGLMESLFTWMQQSKDEVHPLILAAVFHYEFVFIHPFSDGNGRMARLWHTVILSKWKSIFEYIPLESQIEHFQSEYYQAIADSHLAGESNSFIEFMLKCIDDVLDVLSKQGMQEESGYDAYVQKLLVVMEYNVPYSAGELMNLLRLKSRETIRKHYLNPALALGIVTMTLPETPTSRNQRYVKVK